MQRGDHECATDHFTNFSWPRAWHMDAVVCFLIACGTQRATVDDLVPNGDNRGRGALDPSLGRLVPWQELRALRIL